MERHFFIRKNDRYVKIKIEEIQFIEAAGSYLKLVTFQEEFSLSLNLSQFERRNTLPGLVRIHRSFIVNCECIDSFDSAFVYIHRYKVPIGAKFRERFLKAIRCV